jgi:hypothetical protein
MIGESVCTADLCVEQQGSKDTRDVISSGKLIRKGDGPKEIEGLVNLWLNMLLVLVPIKPVEHRSKNVFLRLRVQSGHNRASHYALGLALWRIVAPYLINVRRLSHEDAVSS